MMHPASSVQSILFKTICVITLMLGLTDGDVIKTFFYNYDKAIRPEFENNKPTVVNCSLYVESFGNIEEANMEYKVFTYFLQYWKDPRLAGKLNRTLTIKGSDIRNVWVPDPYCYNARESNMMIPDEETHSSLKVKPNGEIKYSRGVTLLASCIMDLRHFPLDSQECSLQFGSYGHDTEDIIFKWVPGATEVIIGNKEMAQFMYKGSKLTSDVEVFDTGSFSTITATFSFERRVGYFLIQVYFPDMFVVTLSWIVFWMEKDDMGNRMALGITTILTIMFLLGSLNGNMPKVSYPKALDWYLLVSFSFVFLSLVECMIVFIFASSAKKDEEQSADNHNGGVTNMGPNDDLEMVNRATKADKTVVDDVSLRSSRSIKKKRMEKIADNIDRASQVLFPLTFIVYNIFYWTYN
ncbi:Gamma-aminobutyric acid receptor subunit alpha-4 [Desmophyllum pertusum]|uniref:Gamma-aminobutyric acid receptor subunit alpha-4 n=1 Tax=Desmophyllum pertusum TaxID=174260 RepID=A0A9W9ZLH7_9CNID|nr:Gamma-aminobutyric acid receptor subunit alpha-4 [Desmophyllum pertusum]